MSDPLNKTELRKRLINFFDRAKKAKETNSTKGIYTKDIAKMDTSYREMNVKVSYGQGAVTQIPWMTFLQEPFTTPKGVYPYIGADIDNGKIISFIGYSNSNDADISKKSQKEIENINTFEKEIKDFKNIDEKDINELLDHLDLIISDFKNIDFKNINSDNINKKENKVHLDKYQPILNQILYGPPGTGKTYNTINKALEIIFNIDKRNKSNKIIKDELIDKSNEIIKKYNIILDEGKEKDSREKLKKVFEFYKDPNQGQIEFITFHQSYGYEEFIEGIKAKTVNKNIEYSIEPGIFKKLCTKASQKHMTTIRNNSDNKELTKELFRKMYEDFTNNLISKDSKEKSNLTLKTVHNKEFDLFKNSIPSIIVKAGKERVSQNISHNELEKILFSNKEPTYKSYAEIIIDKILMPFNSSTVSIDNEKKNYILIIDEINRGNISKIFGELITLIEPSKRIGENEEIKVKLSYSNDEKDLFGVPKNIYILATMNTADRSIAPIDSALRRRFVFEEMSPQKELLSKNINDINLQQLLEAINIRIEYLYDRDHTIGHAYLIDIKTLDDLKFTFKNKIIPLLSEYFYENWENIDLVLNQNGFIEEGVKKEYYLSKIKSKINGKKIYNVSNYQNWTKKDFIKIYAKDSNE